MGAKLVYIVCKKTPLLLGNDGEEIGNTGLMETKSGIPIPTGPQGAIQGQITEESVDDYWGPRANVFIPWAAQYSDQHGDVLWGWRVIEEPKYDAYGVNTDVYLSKKMRDLTNLYDNGRFRITYAGVNYMPDSDILWTLVEKGETTFPLEPEDPIARAEVNGMVGSFYVDAMGNQKNPLRARVAGGTHLVQMFDHVASGAYMNCLKIIMVIMLCYLRTRAR